MNPRFSVLALVLALAWVSWAAADLPSEAATTYVMPDSLCNGYRVSNPVDIAFPKLLPEAEPGKSKAYPPGRATGCMRYTIDTRGVVTEAVILRTDNPEHAQFAAEGKKAQRYRPAMRDGVPISVTHVQPFFFSSGPQPHDDMRPQGKVVDLVSPAPKDDKYISIVTRGTCAAGGPSGGEDAQSCGGTKNLDQWMKVVRSCVSVSAKMLDCGTLPRKDQEERIGRAIRERSPEALAVMASLGVRVDPKRPFWGHLEDCGLKGRDPVESDPRCEGLVVELVQAGADLNAEYDNGWGTATSLSRRTLENPYMLEILLKHGADANLPVQSCGSLLDTASLKGMKRAEEILARYGARHRSPVSKQACSVGWAARMLFEATGGKLH
jgi:hypothetical protein